MESIAAAAADRPQDWRMVNDEWVTGQTYYPLSIAYEP